MRVRRRGVRSTLTMQAPTAASIHFSNVKQPPAESGATVVQTRRVRPPNLRLEGEEDNRPVLKCIDSGSFNADRTSFLKWWRFIPYVAIGPCCGQGRLILLPPCPLL